MYRAELVMFGENLKKLRTEGGFTQARLAEMLGVGSSCISMYEQGNRMPDSQTLTKISRLFGVSIDALLEDVPPEREQPLEPDEMLGKMQAQMLKENSLMFNGKIMTEDDIKEVMEAMRFGALLRMNQLKGKE